ncbi:MAG: hypothetical protein IGS50_12485 [Synechococcales cyanobacterium C42_A2020_086]|nr:hypothetical protein [Synechococcales cyanobacterium C42_A2020_086]
MPKIAEIKREIEQVLHPVGFSKNGWDSIRRSALIPPGRHSCDYAQAQRLWVAAALRRTVPQNQPITAKEVLSKLKECDGDLSQLIPGFIPFSPGCEALPSNVLGRQLPGLFENLVGYRPDDNRLRAWCRKVGLRYSRSAVYSGAEVDALLQLWRSMRVSERDRSRKLAYQNFHAHLGAA